MKRIRIIFEVISLILLISFAFVSYIDAGLQHYVYNIVAPAVFVFSFIAIPNHSLNQYVKILIVLYLWVAFTSLTAIDQSLAFRQLRSVVGCLLMILSISQLSQASRLIPWLYVVFLFYYFGIVYYAYTNIYSSAFDYTSDRLDDDVLGANTVAYFTFYTTFAVFFLADLVHNKTLRLIFRILFIVTPIWSFIIAILTGSRQVILIQVPLISVLLYLRYFKYRSSLMKFTFVVVCLVAGIFLFEKGLSVYENSLLAERTSDSSYNDPRMGHLIRAVQIGLDHPLVGVGPGNYATFSSGGESFSHSTYLELFANTGFPGLIIFLVLIYRFIVLQWKRSKKTKNHVFLIFLLFGVLFAVDNMLYVFYAAPWLMAFFFLVLGHSENYYQTYISNNNIVSREKNGRY